MLPAEVDIHRTNHNAAKKESVSDSQTETHVPLPALAVPAGHCLDEEEKQIALTNFHWFCRVISQNTNGGASHNIKTQAYKQHRDTYTSEADGRGAERHTQAHPRLLAGTQRRLCRPSVHWQGCWAMCS